MTCRPDVATVLGKNWALKVRLMIYSEHHNSLDSDHFFVILVLYSSSLSLKGYNDNDKVQTVSFNLRVFSYISDEPFRNDSTFCTWSPHFKVLQVFVELASRMCVVRQVYSFVSFVNTGELLMNSIDSRLCYCLWRLLLGYDNMRKTAVSMQMTLAFIRLN